MTISIGTVTNMGWSMGLPPWDVPSFVYGGETFPQGRGGYPRAAALVSPSLGFAGLLLHPSLPHEDHHSSSGSDITMSFSSPGQGLPPPLLYHPQTWMTISIGTATNMGWSMGLPPWDVPLFVYGGGTFPQGHGGYSYAATSVAPSLAFVGSLLDPSLLQEDHQSSSGSDITMSFSSPCQGLPCPLLYHPQTWMTISVGTATNIGWSMELLKRILTCRSSWPTIFSDSSLSRISTGHPFKWFLFLLYGTGIVLFL
jgi:hypothetical protein